MSISYRALRVSDEDFLWQMLAVAAHENNVENAKSYPALARYVEGWKRDGDSGFLALENAKPAGAIWLRLWKLENCGFGFVDEETPELAIAVLPQFQNCGIGSELLKHVLQNTSGKYRAISLNVREDSAAIRLYAKFGFSKVEGSEIINRSGTFSFNMIRVLD